MSVLQWSLTVSQLIQQNGSILPSADYFRFSQTDCTTTTIIAKANRYQVSTTYRLKSVDDATRKDDRLGIGVR